MPPESLSTRDRLSAQNGCLLNSPNFTPKCFPLLPSTHSHRHSVSSVAVLSAIMPISSPFSFDRRSFRLSRRSKKWKLSTGYCGQCTFITADIGATAFNAANLLSISHALANPFSPSLLSTTSDSFVNSQEWTLSRAVPDLRLVSSNQTVRQWGTVMRQ